MLTHDQNEVNTDLKDTELKIDGDQTSQTKPENSVPEQEVNAPTETETIETQVPETENLAPEPIPEEMPTAFEEPPAQESEEASALVEPKIEKPKADLTQEEIEHEKMLSMYDEYTASFESGQIKEGTVVGVTEKDVVVAIGYKSDGVIPISEFSYGGVPEINSVIKVFINRVENVDGKLELSKKKADFIQNIEKIKQASEDGSILQGVVRRRVKGGMIVEVIGIEAFLPGSQMSLKPVPNLDQFIGKELSFKVLSLDEDHKNIILSRKMVLEAENEEKRKELLEKIEIGSELDGEVKNITQYGAFIDLGGIDGLLHLTDMSWGKINHPTEMLNISDKVKVKVINYDAETQKISLGLKQLVPHPWETIELKFPEGTRITGKVMSVKSFGAFVELEPGVEGLVHISEMSWTKKIADARKFLKVGDMINAIILNLDKDNKRISLGMKQMDPNPWLTIEDRYPIGTVLNRKIKSLTAFGAFVEIEEGIDGLIHISDISWTKRVYHPREVYRKNQEVEAVILSIDRALHRIALGVKQLNPDPWQNLVNLLPVNSEVKGKISKLIPKGVLVDIEVEKDVVEGFIPISHLGIPKLEHSEDAFIAGEEIPLKVIELDMENRRLILSVKAFFFSREPKLQEEYVAIHEAYMRERIAKALKKKQEKAQREKQRLEEAKERAARETALAEQKLAQEKSETVQDETNEVPSPEPAEIQDEKAAEILEAQVQIEEPTPIFQEPEVDESTEQSHSDIEASESALVVEEPASEEAVPMVEETAVDAETELAPEPEA